LKSLTISALFCALALTACGGGGGDSPRPAVTTTTTASTTTTTTPSTPTTPPASLASVANVIEYYGDSTIWGWATGSGGTQVARPAPLVFAESFPASPRQEVRNEGVSGTTACLLLNGDGRHAEWNTQMVNSNATVVIINHAINDAKPGSGISTATYKNCLRSLVQVAKAQGKRVILETPNPVSGFSGLESYVTAMKEVAAEEQVSVIDQYQYLLDYLGSRNPEELTPDGLHPTDEVYAMKGRRAQAVFASFPL
jgi:lysophospholipase L1-like esterase